MNLLSVFFFFWLGLFSTAAYTQDIVWFKPKKEVKVQENNSFKAGDKETSIQKMFVLRIEKEGSDPKIRLAFVTEFIGFNEEINDFEGYGDGVFVVFPSMRTEDFKSGKYKLYPPYGNEGKDYATYFSGVKFKENIYEAYFRLQKPIEQGNIEWSVDGKMIEVRIRGLDYRQKEFDLYYNGPFEFFEGKY